MNLDTATIVRVLKGKRVETDDGRLLAWRIVHPDFRSSHDYRWPFPGHDAYPKSVPGAGTTEYTRGDPCPQFDGDGLCLAITFAGAASGNIPATTGLICSYSESDVLGQDSSKLRVSTARVEDVIDVPALLRRRGFYGADLSRADLSRANLYGAILSGSNLSWADLSGSNLSWADLSWAILSGADLSRAILSWANLSGADLSGANLSGAILSEANLSGANLSGANLSGADLSRAIGLPATVGT